LVHRLLWDIIVVDLYWLFDQKGQRSIYWYLDQIAVSNPEFQKQAATALTDVNSAELEIVKVKKLRDKWIAHKDRAPFEDPEAFWRREERLMIEEADRLVEIASNVIQIEREIVDTTSSGIHKIFALSKLISNKEPSFLKTMKEHGVLEGIDNSELQSICQQ
jgi:hydroxymethylpyrimidine pyrophosphatase-like HAD family hydrolase